tara:strand:- start:46 stop:438 length:393 start_codon:yes stop_codon:yes gene_type:complete
MGKFIADTVHEKGLNEIATGDLITLCEGQPVSYAEAVGLKSAAGKRLGGNALTPGDGNGDFTLADGDVSGRKITVEEQTGTVAESGAADHVAIVDTVTSELLLVTTMASQAVVGGNDYTIAAFDYEIPDQ